MRRLALLSVLGLALFAASTTAPLFADFCMWVHEGRANGCCGNHKRMDWYEGTVCASGWNNLHYVNTTCEATCSLP